MLRELLERQQLAAHHDPIQPWRDPSNEAITVAVPEANYELHDQPRVSRTSRDNHIRHRATERPSLRTDVIRSFANEGTRDIPPHRNDVPEPSSTSRKNRRTSAAKRSGSFQFTVCPPPGMTTVRAPGMP